MQNGLMFRLHMHILDKPTNEKVREMTVRIEHDLLGDREIPAEAYWGIHTLRAVENFKISNQKISDVPQFVRSMVMVKKATAQANGELGAVKPEIAAAIEKACDE